MMLAEITTFDDVFDYLSEREEVERTALEQIRMMFPDHQPEIEAMINTGVFKVVGDMPE